MNPVLQPNSDIVASTLQGAPPRFLSNSAFEFSETPLGVKSINTSPNAII